MALAFNSFVHSAAFHRLPGLVALILFICAEARAISFTTDGPHAAALHSRRAALTVAQAQGSPASPAAIAFVFSVDKARPAISDSLIYEIVVWNDPLLSDTLHGVEAEFSLPRLQNGNFALLLATFRYVGPYPFAIDAAQGKITWQLGDIVRHTPRLPSDTVRVAFSFHLAAIGEFTLECGENPLTAFARVSFLNTDGQRIYPGTQRAAESTLVLTPDFVAAGIMSTQQRLRRGDTLVVNYAYRNDGNVGREVQLCMRLPEGIVRAGVRAWPDTLRLRVLPPDSLCIELGFVPAGDAGVVTLRLPVEQNLAIAADSLCLRGTLITDCDLIIANNSYEQLCFQIAPLDLLAIAKSPERNRIAVGDTLVYTIRFENVDSLVTAWNVTIIDTLPRGVDFIAADAPFVFANGVLSWQFAQLSPRQSGIVRLAVRVRADFFSTQANGLACRGAQLANRAHLTSTSRDGSPSAEAQESLANNRSLALVEIAPLGDLLHITHSVTALPPANLANLLPGDTLFFVITYANRNARVRAENVTVNTNVPSPLNLVVINDGGALLGANQIQWALGALPPLATGTVTWRAQVRDSTLCAPVAFQNLAWLDAAPRDCDTSNNASRISITIAATPLAEQARLLVQSLELHDTNGNGCVEVGERMVARISFRNDNPGGLAAQQIRFENPRVVLGARSWPLTLLGVSPPIVAANDSGVAIFEFIIDQNVFDTDTLRFFGSLVAEDFCAQDFAVAAADWRFCPQPQVALTRVDINDDNGNRDGFASIHETLNLVVVYQNLGPITADSVDATITISTPGFNLLYTSRPAINTLPAQIRNRLAPGESDSVFMQVRYDVFSSAEQFVALSAFLQISALAGPQPPVRDQIPILRECYARPNPFIPARHPNGVRFAAEEEKTVKIFDLHGSLMRTLRTAQTWDGRNEDGRLCEPGLYVWKIENACAGTIVVVR